MLTPEDFTPAKFRIHWYAILLIFAVQLTVLIALSIAVANHSSFETASSAATKVGLSVVDDQSNGPLGTDMAAARN
jgi:prolipoprotein diacylglyceryltransferase